MASHDLWLQIRGWVSPIFSKGSSYQVVNESISKVLLKYFERILVIDGTSSLKSMDHSLMIGILEIA